MYYNEQMAKAALSRIQSIFFDKHALTASCMNRERKSKGAAYKASERVQTLRGEGIIKHVYPERLRGRIAYCVNFGSRRLGVVFDEDELTHVNNLKS